ncbi:MAG: ribosome maturation factor RimP [Actinomycetota bacterium]|nr:ribosome maturation factor RimP [Actinomycetota bacterium]
MSALDEVRELAEAVTRRRSLTLWDVELAGQPGRSIVRVFVQGDRQPPDLDTVAAVSEEISRGLDLRDPIPGRYTLEVSTPGLERNLKAPEHFARSVGEKVVLKTTEIIVGNSHRIDGTILSSEKTSVTIDVNGQHIEVPYAVLKSARTVFEW